MSLRVLVADDDPDILALTDARLSKSGYAVLRACDGLSALRLARRERPDVVVLDYAMPGLTGGEVCRLLRADAETRAIPLILLSASAASLGPEELARLPSDAFLVKPFEAEELMEMIDRLHFARLKAPRDLPLGRRPPAPPAPPPS